MTFLPDVFTHSGGETYRSNDAVGSLTQQSASETSAMTPLVVADTLTSGSHPGSNMPGRRREDDTNLTVAYMPHRTLQKDGSVLEGFAERPVIDALHGPTGNKEPLIARAAGVRRLTPVECERLQNLPDNWTLVPDDAPDSRRYAALGDAVTASVAEWIGRRIIERAA